MTVLSDPWQSMQICHIFKLRFSFRCLFKFFLLKNLHAAFLCIHFKESLKNTVGLSYAVRYLHNINNNNNEGWIMYGYWLYETCSFNKPW